MLRWSIGILALLTGAWLTLSPALAGGRVALVIGNGTYEHASGLPNPTRDASDIAAALRSIGFEVSEMQNVSKDAFEAALSDFSEKSVGADFAVIYFAGHGIEVDHQNYLIPTDAILATDRRLRFEAVSLDDVLSTLENVSGIRMVLLDACRNNPFAASMKVTSASRAVGRGFAPVEAAVRGTVISYSARAGAVASDGSGRNSPFAAALLENITKPGLEIQFLLREVRDSVLTATNGVQEPFISASLGRDAVYLVPPADEQPSPLAAEPIAADYQSAERIGTAEAWDAFLAKHGGETGNFHVALANAARQKLALSVPPTLAAEPPLDPAVPLPVSANASPDGPVAIYERAYESLLKRQFKVAEAGFLNFLEKHHDHDLANNAQYWLGETYFLEGKYQQAGKAFHALWYDHPTSPKAAYSLLKAAMSVTHLGKKDLACVTFKQVISEYPNAVDARERAEAEIKRAGC